MKALLVLLCVAVTALGKDRRPPAAAKEVKVRTAWARHYPNATLGIFPDNLGNIAAVGHDTNGGLALLLNPRGREVARVPVPIPGIAGAVADKSGRIFITGNEWRSPIVSCASFAPELSSLLWIEHRNLSNRFSPPSTSAGIASAVPDELGAMYVHGNWQWGFFLSELRGDNSGLQSFWKTTFSQPARWSVTGVRSPSGEIYFVCASVAGGHYYFITIQKFNPASRELVTYGATPPDLRNYFLPTAATCDSAGNVIVVGWHTDHAASVYRQGNYFTMKMDGGLNQLWLARHGPITSLRPGTASLPTAVAVDQNDNVIVTGTAGTLKYSPSGQQLWESPEIGTTLHLDRFGDVLLSRQVGREDGLHESEITKLNANGTRRWQIRVHDGSANDNGPAGLVPGTRGEVYFASQNGQDTTILKLVEHGRVKK